MKKTIIIPIVFILAACGPIKRVSEPMPDPMHLEVEQTLLAVRAQETSFDFFSARYSGTASFDGTSYSISGNMRIRKDSAIYISVAPVLGIEIARMLVTPDSVRFINRLDNSYFEGDISMLSNMLNTYIDYYMLQALLIGNDFSHFSTNDLRVSNDKNRILIQGNNRKPKLKNTGNISFQHNLWVNRESYRIDENLLYEPLTQRSLRAVYHSSFITDGQWTPRELTMAFTEPGARASMSIRYSRVAIDQPQTISFSIPSNYTPLSF